MSEPTLTDVMGAIAAMDQRSEDRHVATRAVLGRHDDAILRLQREVAALMGRVDELERLVIANKNSTDSAIVEVLHEMRRTLGEKQHELEQAMLGANRHGEAILRTADTAAAESRAAREHLEAWRMDVDGLVLASLGRHVERMEKAADRVTKAPRVKTALVLAGSFFGSAVIAAAIALLNYLSNRH
jgi:hypothetical protein